MAEAEGELHEPGSNDWMHTENVPVKIVPAVLEAQWQALIEENHPALIHVKISRHFRNFCVWKCWQDVIQNACSNVSGRCWVFVWP